MHARRWKNRVHFAFFACVSLAALGLLATFAAGVRAEEAPATPAEPRPPDLAAFVKAHCARCHGAEKQEGDVRLDDLPADVAAAGARWRAVYDQLRDGLMPPPDEPRVAAAALRPVLSWLASRVPKSRLEELPRGGNLVPHELLFGRPAPPVRPPAGRVWRLSPAGYYGFARTVAREGRHENMTQPFTLAPDRGFKDFAGLYAIDTPATEVLLRNAESLVALQTLHELQGGQPRGKNGSIREFLELMHPDNPPSADKLKAAIQRQFQLATARDATPEETERLLELYAKCAAEGDRIEAARVMLQAVLMRGDSLFRMELGQGAEVRPGVNLLSPLEMVYALSFALGDKRDEGLLHAARQGKLATREQFAAEALRLWDDPKFAKPRVKRFFREFFEYDIEVFKDKPKTFMHAPAVHIADTDQLIDYVLARDQNVLAELLTTPLSFVNHKLVENKQTRKFDVPQPAVEAHPQNNKGQKDPTAIYGFDQWPRQQPVSVPREERFGVLMQPSWLVAHSTNFENDPVRRGKWVRERLLGGVVPDLPIGVVAQIPDEKHHTLRDRLRVTRETKCWKCHQFMDDLGLPFEQFDHYGWRRAAEPVLDLEATAKNVDKKGAPLGPVTRDVELDTTGLVRLFPAENDASLAALASPALAAQAAELDGPVNNPRELVERLARSPRVRQVFVRHAFRYFLGRNETVDDALTLQQADEAYTRGGGGFKALVLSLLTSDSFLLRSSPLAPSSEAKP